MNQKFIVIIILCLFASCQEQKSKEVKSVVSETNIWNVETLHKRALQHLDSTKRDYKLIKQDLENYDKFADFYKNLPLNKSPFPVAEYDYAVSSFPFVIQKENNVFKGIKIGEFETPESDKIIEKLTLLVLTNDINSEENFIVESRNYPYLTAEGFFKTSTQTYDWVFASSPDGFSVLLVNMKLFDVRFGETIIIYPQKDGTFLYDQIQDSPNNYTNFEDFKTTLINLERTQNQLSSENNI